jgi:hypothetical protein
MISAGQGMPPGRLVAPQMPQGPGDEIPLELLMQMLGSGAAAR